MTNKERLLALAAVVEGYEEFAQGDADHCTVKLAERMMKEDSTAPSCKSWNELADYFGITISDLDALYVADFGELNIGLVNRYDMDDVTREEAAEALRLLAARE